MGSFQWNFSVKLFTTPHLIRTWAKTSKKLSLRTRELKVERERGRKRKRTARAARERSP